MMRCTVPDEAIVAAASRVVARTILTSTTIAMAFAKVCRQAIRLAAAALLGTVLWSAASQAADVDNGMLLYNTWCAGCHGADPRQSQPHLAANKPKVLRDAIDLVTQMSFLESILSTSDIDDLAAYIGSVSTTGVVVLNPTPGSIDFSLQAVGLAGAPQTLLLTNLGSVALNIAAITVTPADFTVAGDCLGNRNPSSTCALLLTFNPLAAGSIAGRVRVDIDGAEPLVVPLLGAGGLPESTPLPIVVEYYNPDLDNYFITADADEQRFVDSGAVGRWLRTGNAFRSGGSVRVCRFYGNAAPNPSTGRIYGPNSHFYTISQSECDWLKAVFDERSTSWLFESLDFAASPNAGPACAAGLVPVYRAYNNGAVRGIDSNHRITTNRTSVEQVISRGWIDEGIVMCVPGTM
ncbi:MAG: choice-of-anchor D domain-containing protein [Betaproteobacteria bacterium]